MSDPEYTEFWWDTLERELALPWVTDGLEPQNNPNGVVVLHDLRGVGQDLGRWLREQALEQD